MSHRRRRGSIMRNSVSTFALAFAIIAAPAVAFAQSSADEVIVTASRGKDGVRRDLLGASVTVIDPVALETRQTRILSDVLRDVPGVSVNRAGGAGQLTEIRIRGAEADHTLVLIDGMKASDPWLGEFDFATLIADDVARVEVLRGQQSALYGSEAIGGVIHYITASGAEAPGVRGRVEYGSFNSYDATGRAAGVTGPLDYAISAGYQGTDGTPIARNGKRDVGATNGVLSGRFVYALSNNFRFRAVGRYSQTKADLDDQDFKFPSPTYGFVIDSDDYYKNKAAYGLLSAENEGLGGRWSNVLSVQGVDAGRDGYSGGTLAFGDDASRLRASYVSSLKLGTDAFAQTITGAVDYERQRFQNTGPFLTPAQGLQRQIENKGLVAQYDVVVNDRLGLGAALRYDDNDRFDNATTYRLQASYRFETATRIHAAGGSGVKNPGVFELFGFDPGSFVGNPNLKPEKSEGWEAGVEQGFLDGAARADITVFDNTLEDEVFTAFGGAPLFLSSPGNRTNKSRQRGVELSGHAAIEEAWTLDAAYTYLNAKESGLEEVRRPPHIASVNLAWRSPSDQFGAYASVRYNGRTYDNNFTFTGPPRVQLPSFTLVNLGGDVKVTPKLSVYARVENAFDEQYEEVYTYRSRGRAGYIGVRAEF
jgi:vitamin B12 transporter